jgi:hypothetical protein
MSLRVFHMVFVLVCILLSLYVALWGVREFANEREALGLVLAIVFAAAAVSLVVYGKRVFRKLKELP